MQAVTDVEALQKLGIRAEKITTYKELDRIRDGFVEGYKGFKLSFLILIGPQGSSKTTAFRNCPDTHYVNNAVSAIGLYIMAWKNKDKTIILDDVDDLLRQPEVVAILKALGDSGENKHISWEKQNAVLHAKGIPPSFQTSSRLCIICNELPSVSKNLQAVLDRAKLVVFVPTAQEIHNFVSTWWPAEDRDVLGFIGANLDHIVAPSIRWYQNAQREKLLGLNWREWLLKQWYNEEPHLAIIAELHRRGVARGKPMEKEFHRITGLNRAMFYRHQSRFLKTQSRQGDTHALGKE